MILTKRCGTAGCHDRGSTFPDLVTPPVEMALIGKKATMGDCTGMNFVDPSGPVTGSVFMKRLTGGTCGDQMPYFMITPYLVSSELQCVTDWLTSKLK